MTKFRRDLFVLPAVEPSRRWVLTVGAAAAVLAGCTRAPVPADNPVVGSGAGDSTVDPTPSNLTSSTSSSTAASSSAPATPASTAASPSARGTKLASLSDLAVGSSIAAKDPKAGDILITRTAQASVVAFSATCPHQGCTVPASFACPCHGSSFDPKTGARLGGPAPTGLSSVSVAISGSDIVTG